MRRLIIPLSVAAVLACPAGAMAAKKPVKLNFKVEGSQTTEWKYTKKQNPTCDFPEIASGKQTIEFESLKKGVTMEARQSGDGVVFDEKGFLIAADASQQRSWDTLYSQISPCPDTGGPFGGGDGTNQDSHGEAKCDILGSIEFRVAGQGKSLYDPGEEVPKAAQKTLKDRLWFRGIGAYQGSGVLPTNLPAACSDSGQGGADIGLTYGQPEWSGGLVDANGKVKVKDLLRKKKTVIEGQRIVKYPSKSWRQPGPPDTTGKTTYILKVTITRVK